jgi:hypothetical protein
VTQGITVDPEKLGEFMTEVAKIHTNYDDLVAQLSRADITPHMPVLVGDPGHSGPPTEFADASKALLDDYEGLLTTLHQVHVAVAAQFKHMTESLGQAQQLYLQADADHAALLHGIMNDRPTGGR